MKIKNLSETLKGWFIGDFEGAIYRTRDAEVAIKFDPAGTRTTGHVHRKATEVTVVVKGKVRINGREFGEGTVILIAPGEGAEYEAIEDSITAIVKLPSRPHDKHPLESRANR